MGVAAIRGGAELNRVAGEQHPLLRQPDHGVARSVRAPDMDDLHLAASHPQRHLLVEGDVWPGEARDALLAAEQPWEAADLAVHILLPALHDHVSCDVRVDDFGALVAGSA